MVWDEAQRRAASLWRRLGALGAAARAGAGRLEWGVAAVVVRAEPGQSMVEYAILVAVVVVALVAVLQAFTGGLAQVFNNLLARIQSIGA
jgi:Flp pilus assembly pilin Flp